DDDRKKREEAGSWPKSGYRPGLQRKEGLQSNETPGPKSKFQGDKEQPKSGTFKRAVTTPKQASLEKKKPLRVETSDSETESSSGTKGFKREPIKSPVRTKPAGKDGRNSFKASRWSQAGARKYEKRPITRASSKDDSRSPRSSVLSDSKSNKKEPSYLRSGPKAGPNSTRDLSPPRTAEKKSYGFKSSFRMSDKDKDSENRASKGPTEFEFSRYETHSLRVVKLKRPLPANLAGTHYALVENSGKAYWLHDFKTPFLIWNDTFISMERLTQLKPFQRVNHFPGMAEICRKDLLAKNMGKLNQRYPSEYKFAPRTWCLPDQLANFRQHTQEQKSEVKPSYICKPVDGTSGRGIKIYRTAEEVPQTVESQCVLQEYVSNPFLIENVKFDLRLYVLVSSCDPLRIYLFNDGFIRMSSEPYVDPQKCKADEDLNFIHLTNCSVNKQNRPTDTYGAASRRRGAKVSGMKRPLMFLNSYLQQNKYDVALVWRRIVDLIIKTVFAAYPHVVRSYRQCRPTESPGSGSACFELLGFDILLDTDLKPWLMEVNRSPSFDYDNSEEENPADWKAAKQTADSPEVPAKTAQKEVTELTALLARLKRQDRMKDVDTRICQRFRCIFPVDDATKQEKLVSVMLDAISALLEGSQMEALHREVKTFNASKTDEVAKKLAQLGSKTVQQLMDDGQAGSSGSDSEIDDQAAGGRRKPAAGRLPLKDGQKKSLRKSQEKQKDPGAEATTSSMMANEREQLAQRTLKFLNELSIRFPGKSNRAAEQMLRQLQDNWLARKADVSSYWRLSLDADKRRKVIDIARQNVRIALDKALRMTASDVAAAADNLASLFEKLYNRLLWCHGQGLWETFAGNTGWELILRQSREAPTETEINCSAGHSMQRRRTRTDSTEDSESSSSSPHNSTTAAQGSGGAADGWQHTLQSAAVSAAIVSSVAAVTAESAMVTTAQPRRHRSPPLFPPPAASAASLLQHRRIARRLAARRRLPRSLRDLASSDESAQDADDEASASAGLNDADRLGASTTDDFNDFEGDDDSEAEIALDEAEDAFEEVRAVEEAEAEEAVVVEETQSSDEFAAGAVPWPAATNDDFVEFIVDDAIPAAATAAAAAGMNWGERMRRDTWRLFRRRRAAALATAAAAAAAASNFGALGGGRRDSRWHPRRRRSLPLRSVPVGGGCSTESSCVAPALLRSGCDSRTARRRRRPLGSGGRIRPARGGPRVARAHAAPRQRGVPQLRLELRATNTCAQRVPSFPRVHSAVTSWVGAARARLSNTVDSWLMPFNGEAGQRQIDGDLVGDDNGDKQLADDSRSALAKTPPWRAAAVADADDCCLKRPTDGDSRPGAADGEAAAALAAALEISAATAEKTMGI
uniref:Tubulin--tyrosine ligase-like protein 9 n=1 Tax=Macrostomum lignano TaxID=282301 RepID=A0A1I8FLT0_9PLAT